MPSPDRKVRVFISSTFKDMHAERDHLVTVVFPELRERCERLGLEFFDVDLRWGVPEKTQNQVTANLEEANSWEYCRQWIDRVQPFFVCILGQRYGWVPPPEKLKKPEDAERQKRDPRSITDMEVHYALLDEPGQKRLSYFYLRETTVPRPAPEAPKMAWQIYSDYVDGKFEGDHFIEDTTAAGKLTKLKQAVTTCGRPARHYRDCEWKDDHFTKVESFGTTVLEDLWAAVLRDERYVSKAAWEKVLGADPLTSSFYTDAEQPLEREFWEKLVAAAKPPPKNPLEAEREQMAAFAASRLRWFQGRMKELNDLTAFIRDPAADDKPRLALIAAVPGQGKSALMAKLWESLQPKETKEEKEGSASPPLIVSASPSLHFITHFVGATEQSSTAYALVKRLNDELDASGIAFPERPTPEGQPKEEPKLDFNSLCHRFYERLGDYAGERRIVILLDALNQLNDGHELGWLPYRLGPSVRVVVSCIEESDRSSRREEAHSPVPASDPSLLTSAPTEQTPAQKVLATLNSRHPQPLRIPLGELTPDDVRTIVVEYLREYCHELDREHLDTLCAIPQARNPLYLTVMLHELRTLGGNDLNTLVPARIAAMPQDHPDTVSLFHWVLERMEQAEGFGEQAVRQWCLYLALGRVGMASRELADLLKRKLGDEAALTAQRIERGLRRYLQRRGETLDFFHGQLRQAVMEKYGKEANNILQPHNEIADYFRDVANPTRGAPWSGTSTHALNELPYHQICGRVWPDLVSTLEDIFFLEIKVTHGMTFGLADDFSAAVRFLPPDHAERQRIGLLHEALRRDLHFIARHAIHYPQGLFQCLWNSCWWFDSPEAARHYRTAARAGIVPEPPWKKARGLRLSSLMEKWRSVRGRLHPDFLWVRSLRPPATHLASPQIAVMQGHQAPVWSVAISQDGLRVASGSADGTLRLWRTDNGRELMQLVGNAGELRGVAFTGRGDCRLASGCEDGTIKLWDAEDGREIMTLSGHEGSIRSIAGSPDGRILASGATDATVRLWDSSNGKEITTLRGHKGEVRHVAFREDGKQLLSVGFDDSVRIWDVLTHREVGRQPEELLSSAALGANGQRMALGYVTGMIHLWEVTYPRVLARIEAHGDIVAAIVFSPDGRCFASSSRDGTIKLWDANIGVELGTYRGHEDYVTSLAFSRDGRRLISGSFDRSIRLWDLRQQGESRLLYGHEGVVNSVAFSPDGEKLASVGGSSIRLWNTRNGRPLAILAAGDLRVLSVAFSPDGKSVATGHIDHCLRVWDARHLSEVANLVGHENAVLGISFSQEGTELASASADRTVRLWDVKQCRELCKLSGHKDEVVTVVYTVDGLRLASAGGGELGDNAIRIWARATGRELAAVRGHEGDVFDLAFDEDGETIVSVSGDQKTRWWAIEDGKCERMIEGISDALAVARGPANYPSLAVSQSEGMIVTDASTERPLAWFPDPLSSVRTHPDGNTFAGESSIPGYMALLRLEGNATEARGFHGKPLRLVEMIASRFSHLWRTITGN